jgi:hypothetical protein
LKTLDITFRAETEDGQEETVTLAQKDTTFVYMTVRWKSYKIDLQEFVRHLMILEIRRRDMEAR